MSFASMVSELKSTTSRLEKEEILELYGTPFVKYLLQETFDPTMLHNVRLTKRDIPVDSGVETLEDREVELRSLFMGLERSYSSKENKSRVVYWMSKFLREDQEVFLSVVNKNLKAGVSIKTINKVFPNLIPVVPIQLAHKYSPSKLYHQENWLWSFKLDGMRVFCFRIDDEWKIFSRAKDFLGREISTLNHWKEGLELMFIEHGFSYVEGEAYRHGYEFDVIQSAVMSHINKKKELAKTILLHAFIVGDCQNKEDPNEVVNVQIPLPRHFYATNEIFSLNQNLVGNTPLEIGHYLDDALLKGYEGIMLRDPERLLVNKRSDYLLKVKADSFDDSINKLDCVVVDVIFDEMTVQEDGHITTEWLPVRLEVEQPDGVLCLVGSGFSMDWRRETAKNPDWLKGKTIEVFFQGYGARGRMRFPRYHRTRLDV